MAKTPRSLSGKVAVVTGGARGIGQALARALAREGVVVAIGDLDAAAAEAAAAELGNGSIGLALDVTDRPGFTAFLDEVEQRLGPLDILVNNAGIMHVTPLDEEDDASVTRQLEINLHAVIHGTQEAMRRMRPRNTGHIVNVASLAGRAAAPGPGHLLRHQARRHRPLRGRPRRAARHRRRGHRRHARLRQDRARRPASRTCAASSASRPRRSPRDRRRAQGPALRRLGARRLAAIIWLGAVLPRRWREAVSRAMNSNRVVATDRAPARPTRPARRRAPRRPRSLEEATAA